MYGKVFVDTNILLNSKFNIDDYEMVFISIVSIEELDHQKSDERLGYQARKALRAIKDATNVEIKLTYSNNEVFNKFLERGNDNHILRFALEICSADKDVIFLVDDFSLYTKAGKKGLDLNCSLFEFKQQEDIDYKGYKEVTLSEYEMAVHYQCQTNKFDLLNNEYLVIKDGNGIIVDKQRWTDLKGFTPLSYRQIDNMYSGKIKPRNIQQELSFDLFQNKNITVKVVFGKHGAGKDLIMSSNALNMIQRGVYDKLIFVRNNYIVANSKEIGYLPGSADDKLLPFAMPLADHVGGVDGLKMLVSQGKIELQHLGFIRGRDIKNSIVYCTEAENMTKEHIQLLISRLAEGSTLWLNGDFKQVDDAIFTRNSGLKQLINSLKGQELFGCVELNTTERSKTAQLADLLG